MDNHQEYSNIVGGGGDEQFDRSFTNHPYYLKPVENEFEEQYISDDYYDKERELRQINDMRIKTLEKIIKEKVQIVQNQEQEIDQYLRQNQNLQRLVEERELVLSDYESKFDRIKTLITEKDMELSSTKAQLQSIYEQYIGEKDNGRKLQERIDILQDQLRNQEFNFKDQIQDALKAKESEVERELRLLKQKLREKEKRLESVKINSDERLNLALESKDKEIRQLQEQLSNVYQEQSNEITQLRMTIQEFQSDAAQKDKTIESLKSTGSSQQSMMQQHIDRLKEVLNQKTDMIGQMDQNNRTQLEQINSLKTQLSSQEIKLSNQMHQQQFERDQMMRDMADKQREFQEQINQIQLDHQKQIKSMEREKRKVVKDFEMLKEQLRDKEKGVRGEIEKVWTEWEDRCNEIEDTNKQLEFKINESENKNRELSKQIQALKKENKQIRDQVETSKQEVKIIQNKYEDELQSKEKDLEEIEKKFKSQEEYYQFEIVHLKNELEKMFKTQHAQKLNIPMGNNGVNYNGGQVYSGANAHNFATNNNNDYQSFRLALNQIASNSNRQSNDKTPAGVKVMGSMNDSLDYMKREFQNQFNQLMLESGAAGTFKDRENMLSPMSRLSRFQSVDKPIQNQGGNNLMNEKDLEIKQLQLENEELKTIVEQMKVDMETIVSQVKSGKLGPSGGGAGNIQLQQEIITKERKIFELERKLKQKDDEIERLKQERDRLIQISNEIRAEMNQQQRIIQQYKDKEMYQSERQLDNESDYQSEGRDMGSRGGYINNGRQTADFNTNIEGDRDQIYQIPEQQDRITRLDRYVEELAFQMKSWIENDMYGRDQVKRGDERRIGGGGRIGGPSSGAAIDRKKSQSPNSRMRKQGEEFLRRIEMLKDDLQLEGKQLQNFQSEIQQEKMNLRQSEKLTPSQKQAQEKLKRALDKKKDQENKPKVRNYAIREQHHHLVEESKSQRERNTEDQISGLDDGLAAYFHTDENQNQNLQNNGLRRAKTGVGANSNLRRNTSDGGFVPKKTPSKKVGNEIIL